MNSPKCILLADDDRRDVDLLLALLGQAQHQYEVVVAQDGAEALDFLYGRGAYQDRSLNQPTMVLLDLKMPKVDGLAVLQQIKNDPRLKTIPVIMLTSSRETNDVRKSYQLGANGFVVKPVDFQELREVVRRIELFWINTNEPPPPSDPASPRQSLEKSLEASVPA